MLRGQEQTGGPGVHQGRTGGYEWEGAWWLQQGGCRLLLAGAPLSAGGEAHTAAPSTTVCAPWPGLVPTLLPPPFPFPPTGLHRVSLHTTYTTASVAGPEQQSHNHCLVAQACVSSLAAALAGMAWSEHEAHTHIHGVWL